MSADRWVSIPADDAAEIAAFLRAEAQRREVQNYLRATSGTDLDMVWPDTLAMRHLSRLASLLDGGEA